MSYNKINWRDYPDTTTPVNATNLGIMDGQIKANADAIGDISEISEISGTLSGAISSLNGEIGLQIMSKEKRKSQILSTSTATAYADYTEVKVSIYGATPSVMLNALNSLDKPKDSISVPIVVTGNNNAYPGYLYYSNNTWTAKYINSSWQTANINASAKVYADFSYIKSAPSIIA